MSLMGSASVGGETTLEPAGRDSVQPLGKMLLTETTVVAFLLA